MLLLVGQEGETNHGDNQEKDTTNILKISKFYGSSTQKQALYCWFNFTVII